MFLLYIYISTRKIIEYIIEYKKKKRIHNFIVINKTISTLTPSLYF